MYNRAVDISTGIQGRNMGTLGEIQRRLNSIKNIRKITKSMKMISSTKVSKAQRAMEQARVYGSFSSNIYQNTKTTPLENENNVYIVSPSDRGLCGGIHSSAAKMLRPTLTSSSSVGKAIPTFTEAAAAADSIFTSGVKLDNVSAKALKASENFAAYELDEEALVEGHASEMSAKRTAMENATKNATKNTSEMVDRLTMAYNRTRQAAITSELVDIITGASAL
ncbi:atp3 gamma subunit of the F1 sector of mitochondrial F1F0 ATP synthase [Mortierella polycephala]|uniref:ATP synthase subunit gamma, mitochondrial n=1 Tax=Mortierella polycephala TaxID=41804 RepID=A0A9P6Q7K9_9FUNG|nr:atp3 gamma subunit of the F1 sector of mitochondrial F1F0 ATP synthase [Mortierella polycephala]